MSFGVKVVGGLNKIRKDLKAYELKLKKNSKAAATKAGQELQAALRQQVVSAGLGERVAKTWRLQVYPKSGASLNSAASVYSKAPHIISSFDKGTVIKSSSGFFLAIPSENAPGRGGAKRERLALTPSNFPEHIYGRLRFVYAKSGIGLLVVDNLRASYAKKTGELRGFKKASTKAIASGKGLTTVVMFYLVPQINPKKRLNVDAAARAAQADFMKYFNEAGQSGE